MKTLLQEAMNKFCYMINTHAIQYGKKTSKTLVWKTMHFHFLKFSYFLPLWKIILHLFSENKRQHICTCFFLKFNFLFLIFLSLHEPFLNIRQPTSNTKQRHLSKFYNGYEECQILEIVLCWPSSPGLKIRTALEIHYGYRKSSSLICQIVFVA